MGQIGTIAAQKLASKLRDPENGIISTIGELELAVNTGLLREVDLVSEDNLIAELADRTGLSAYPRVHVYCEKITNRLREKFRTFSGTARLCAELRVSQDRVDGLERRTHLLVDTVSSVLESSRGDWGDGIYYSGAYEIQYSPVKLGGKHLIQITKITFEVDVNTN